MSPQERFETRLRLLPCIVAHHIGTTDLCEGAITLHHVGPDTERDDMNQAPLCYGHHQGPMGVHGLHRRAFERHYRLSDLKLLAITRRLYLKEFGA